MRRDFRWLETIRLRKRWIAASVLIFTTAYAASNGPAYYLLGRWPTETRAIHSIVYAPLRPLMDPDTRVGRAFRHYTSWWYHLGSKHSGRPEMRENGIPLWNAGTRRHPEWVTQPP